MSGCKDGNVRRSEVTIKHGDFTRLARKASRSPEAHARLATQLEAAKGYLARAKASKADHFAQCETCDGAA